MKRVFIHILYIALIAAACSPLEEPNVKIPGGVPGTDFDPSIISPAALVDTRTVPQGTKSGEFALIDQVTTRQIDANFLRIDEQVDANNVGRGLFYTSTAFLGGGYPGNADKTEGVNWESAYLSEATVISSPDNTKNVNYRSIIFNPQQAYNILTKLKSGSTEKYDTTQFYHTRMVGWYPRNCSLIDQVNNTSQQFNQSYAYEDPKADFPKQDKYYVDSLTNRKYKAVKFTGLDGSKDVMVSNVCEGQYWHSKSAEYSPSTTTASNQPYRCPFGHYQQYNETTKEFSSRYSNYFKFRHYMSGVRFWGFVPEQNTHSLDMWGKINDVMLLNQPTSVCVSLPEKPYYDANGNSLSWIEDANASYMNDPERWGQAFDWGDIGSFPVQRGSMFGDDTNHADENFTVDFDNVDMTGVGDINSALYLGYALVRPDHEVEVQIHTRYGVYVTQISNTYKYVPAGSVESTTVEIFKPGYYYDVYLSLQTDGTIAALIEDRGDEKYFDLTHDTAVSIDGVSDGSFKAYKYSNTYIVDPAKYDGSDADNVCDYDGFFFSALVPGNGAAGILNYNSQEFYPKTASLDPISAHLIWESSRLLVSNVELINGYVKFKIPEATNPDNYSGSTYTGTKGNAVIGVFDQNDHCLWSWQIWITDTPDDIAFPLSAQDTLFLMDRNLGATFGGTAGNRVPSAENRLASYGLYYQWGRKDPSMGPPTADYSQMDCSTATYYDYASDEYNDAFYKSFNYPSLQNGVENPMYMILPVRKLRNGYLYDWLEYVPDNVLWGYNHSNNTTSKSIYDPCPFGYRVPTGELETVMRSGSYANDTYGLTFSASGDQLFFPFAGFKGVDKGMATLSTEWLYVGQKGDYQEGFYSTSTSDCLYYRRRNYISSASNWVQKQAMGEEFYCYGSNNVKRDGNYGYYEDVAAANGSNVFIDYTNRRTAASVRCIKDLDLGSVKITLEPAQNHFSLGEAVSIQLAASTSQTTLSNVKFTITHKLNGVNQESVVINRPVNSASWNQVYTFTVNDADYIQTTNGDYVLKLEATNSFGIVKASEVHLTYDGAGHITVASEISIGHNITSALNATTGDALQPITSVVSSDENIVSVSQAADGTWMLTGVNNGIATLTIHADGANGHTAADATTTVTVADLTAQNLSFSQSEVTIKYGQTPTKPTLTGVKTTVSYTSSNTNVATVDSNGNVTIVGVGTTEITANAAGNGEYASASASYTVQVTKRQQTITLSYNSPVTWGTQLSPTVTGAVTSVSYEIVSSSKEGVATIDAGSGTVTTNKGGTVTVRATAIATDGNVAEAQKYYESASAEFTITVNKKNHTFSITSPINIEVKGTSNTVDPATSTIPATADEYNVTYTSDLLTNNKVSYSSGTLTAVNYGSGTLNAHIDEDDKYYELDENVTVNVYAYVLCSDFKAGYYALASAVSNNSVYILSGATSTIATTSKTVSNGVITAEVPTTHVMNISAQSGGTIVPVSTSTRYLYVQKSGGFSASYTVKWGASNSSNRTWISTPSENKLVNYSQSRKVYISGNSLYTTSSTSTTSGTQMYFYRRTNGND